MENMEKDIRLKTKIMGFDKKTVMDFIEQIQLENESLKREVQELKGKQTSLLKENAMLYAKIDVFTDGVEKAARKASASSPIHDVHKLVESPDIEVLPETDEADEDASEVEYKVTYEDLGGARDAEQLPYDMAFDAIKEKDPTASLSTVQEATPKKGKPAGKFVVSSKKSASSLKGKAFVKKK